MINKYISEIIPIKIILSFLYIFICLGVAALIGFDTEQIRLLVFLLINQCLISFILFFRSNLSGLHHFAADSLLSILDRLLMIVLVSFLLWNSLFTKHLSIEMFVYFQTIAYLITLLIVFLKVNNYIEKIKLQFKARYITRILSQSLPFAIFVLLVSVYNRVDAILLERILPDGKYEAGMYAQSFRFMDAFQMIGFLFAGLLFPIFSKMLKKKEDVRPLVQLSFSIIILPSIVAAILSFFYYHPIMKILYYEYSEKNILFPLMIAYIGFSANYIFSTLLSSNGNLRELISLSLIALAINLILNIIFIPFFKSQGAAITCAVTQITAAVFQIVYSKNRIGISLDKTLIYKLLIFTIMIVAFCFLIGLSHLQVIPIILLTSVLSVILILVLRIFPVHELIEFFKGLRHTKAI